ncbi:hypothetical protein Q31b_06910 [Novipirellula aureliae]|uniref:Uncharacterized protein n=1 Tax=Novipirellula aureliae TaxID=2527966 RepID=A0A5C6E9K0_9BACT|nr:hypothetical protein [Novipirellula aureliae]TWU45518.1 hypothetical protein Q31b_06910 [Novipirellula aureliae]
MPPTLFQLPNLYRPVASEVAQDATDSTQPTLPHQPASRSVNSEPVCSEALNSGLPAVDESEVESSRSEIKRIDRKDSATSNPPIGNSLPKPSRKSIPSDWIRTVRANGTVLTLLFAVILAALFVGHRERQRAQQASNETVETGTTDGNKAGFEASVSDAFASSVKPSSPSPTAAKSSDERKPADSSVEVPPSLQDSGIEAKTVSATSSRLNPYASDRHASVPATESAAVASLPSATGYAHTQTDQPAGPDFTGLDSAAKTANASLGEPQVAPASQMSESAVRSSRYPQTPTPQGISDWSPYLPPSR